MNEFNLRDQLAKQQAYQAQRQALITTGLQALNRLITVAVRPTGQGRVIGRFLLGLYNGPEYPFDLTELRGLDLAKFEDCLRVLMMDYSPEVEIHERVPNGFAIWAELVAMWAPKGARA
ncbi:hypothetical protein CDO45_02250 [Pseudomonas aeruginosa]|uniref:DUF7673 family protein n=1 Tax=Pseudomonas aeruginosa TaxID=287 RepID=UPI000B41F147|nr:hypothetical protein [Pseudomonas aeruginosa]OVZ20523.1 hypothetical protein CDO45_02250 [Pseudomonas aeruginosa]